MTAFHVFCDRKGIPEADRAPVSAPLLQVFLAALAGAYARSTISNYYSAVRAWHIVHHLPWHIAPADVAILLRAAENMAPPSSKRAIRDPYTVPILEALFLHLDPSSHLDAAVRACAVALFFGVARCGEFTVRAQRDFLVTKHVTIANMREDVNRDGNRVTVLHAPSTKTDPVNGQDICFAAQRGPLNPVAALDQHLTRNHPQPGEHLFTYQQARGKRVPLTRSVFLKRISDAATAAHVPRLQGHSFRIGGTLEYLLRGRSFETVKSIGRWTSDAFLIYLRRHAQILARHLQDQPDIHAEFVRFTL